MYLTGLGALLGSGATLSRGACSPLAYRQMFVESRQAAVRELPLAQASAAHRPRKSSGDAKRKLPVPLTPLSGTRWLHLPTRHRPSVAVRRALRKLGQDIHDARRRRGLPAGVVAERAFTSRPTLQRIERGDASVSVGIYAAVLHALGLLEGLGQLADPSRDVTGLAMAAERLPQRVRLRRSSEEPDG